MVVERRGNRHIESIAFLMSLQPCHDMSDVRVLRSDIPIVQGHSEEFQMSIEIKASSL